MKLDPDLVQNQILSIPEKVIFMNLTEQRQHI